MKIKSQMAYINGILVQAALLIMSQNVPAEVIACTKKAPQKSSFIHALLVIDSSDPKLQAARDADGKNVERLMTTAFGPGQCQVKRLSGAEATETGIWQYLKGLPENLNGKTLFCYVSSPGGYDFGDGHYLQLGNVRLRRNDLLARLKAKKAQTTILINDAYSELLAVEPSLQKLLNESAPAGSGPSSKHPEAIKGRNHSKCKDDLFWWGEGVADFTTAGNQVSFADPHSGGYFTQSFVRACLYEFDQEPMRHPLVGSGNTDTERRKKLFKATQTYRAPVKPTRGVSYDMTKFRYPGNMIDRDGDGFVSSLEFMEFNWKHHLEILYEGFFWLPIEVPLEFEPVIARGQLTQPSDQAIQILEGSFEYQTREPGLSALFSREYVVCPNYQKAIASIKARKWIPECIRIAKNEEHARQLFEREFRLMILDLDVDPANFKPEFKWTSK